MSKYDPNDHSGVTLNRMSPTDSYGATVSIQHIEGSNTPVRLDANIKTKELRVLAETSKNEVNLISDFTE